ncbi:MAG: alpha-L-fucosidase [Planctomycetota bacterium]|jgi:alpha-L-fucosidase
MMKNAILLAMVAAITFPAMGKKYEPSWESLVNYEAPEWYEDAKLGFWVHWGVYSVPAAAFQRERTEL